jgi:hypothetical protein
MDWCCRYWSWKWAKNKLTTYYARNDVLAGKSLISTAYFSIFIIFSCVLFISLIINIFIDWTKILNVSKIYFEELRNTSFVIIISLSLRFVIQLIIPILAAFQKTRYGIICEATKV